MQRLPSVAGERERFEAQPPRRPFSLLCQAFNRSPGPDVPGVRRAVSGVGEVEN